VNWLHEPNIAERLLSSGPSLNATDVPAHESYRLLVKTLTCDDERDAKLARPQEGAPALFTSASSPSRMFADGARPTQLDPFPPFHGKNVICAFGASFAVSSGTA
jgi:hypothetical protein